QVNNGDSTMELSRSSVKGSLKIEETMYFGNSTVGICHCSGAKYRQLKEKLREKIEELRLREEELREFEAMKNRIFNELHYHDGSRYQNAAN
ncbi:13394_t:CDS:2, partial [Dentiscutata heterogama]